MQCPTVLLKFQGASSTKSRRGSTGMAVSIAGNTVCSRVLVVVISRSFLGHFLMKHVR